MVKYINLMFHQGCRLIRKTVDLCIMNACIKNNPLNIKNMFTILVF